jgi:hypothetical protein
LRRRDPCGVSGARVKFRLRKPSSLKIKHIWSA